MFRYKYILKQQLGVKFVLKKMLANARMQGHTEKELLCGNGNEFDNAEIREIL